MRLVRDREGRTYRLLDSGDGESLVWDPADGTRRTLPADDLEWTDGDPLTAASRAVPEAVRLVCRVAHDDAVLGLLVEFHERGPLAVRELLAASEYCESDLNGVLAELRAGGAIEETDVSGERGYRLTDDAAAGVAVLRRD